MTSHPPLPLRDAGGVSHPKQYACGEIVVIVPPEHVDTFAKGGWTKEQVREQIQRAAPRPVRELVRDADRAEGLPPEAAARLGPDTLVPKFPVNENITPVAAGGEAGKFGAFIQGRVGGSAGSTTATVRIDA